MSCYPIDNISAVFVLGTLAFVISLMVADVTVRVVKSWRKR